MATQDNNQSSDRNDPAIDPDTPDNGMGHSPTPGQSQGQGSQEQGSQSQKSPDGETGDNSYTPDFDPEEHKSPDTTKQDNETGETDRDIESPGG